MSQTKTVRVSEAPLVGHDRRYRKTHEWFELLWKHVSAYAPSRESALQLNVWMLECSAEYRIQDAFERDTIGQTLADQINLCTKLEEFATFISSNLDFWHQASALDTVLSAKYRSMFEGDSASTATTGEWACFRERLHRDTELLARTAKQACAELKTKSAKKGRPSKAWRNDRFAELVRRLEGLGITTHHERIDVAICIWNTYFEDHGEVKVTDTDAADKIVQRRRSQRHPRGH